MTGAWVEDQHQLPEGYTPPPATPDPPTTGAGEALRRATGGEMSRHPCEPPANPIDGPDTWTCPTCHRPWQRKENDGPEYYETWYDPKEPYEPGCPRCGSLTHQVQLFDDRPSELFEMCTRCNWGED